MLAIAVLFTLLKSSELTAFDPVITTPIYVPSGGSRENATRNIQEYVSRLVTYYQWTNRSR